MNLLLNASIIAGSLFLLNMTEPAKASTIDPLSSTAPDSHLLLAANEGHGGGGHASGHGGGGHGGGSHFGGSGHGSNWGAHDGGYGYGDVDIGVGVGDDCWTDEYGNTQCNYDD